jgi:superfamily II DNA or RNA helicase
MWVYINRDKLDRYLSSYPEIGDELSKFSLLETKDAVFLPRLFTENYPSKDLVVYNGKNQVSPVISSFKFNKSLRDEQIPIVNTVLEKYKKSGFVNGIIQARPGIGKTVMSVYLSSKIGLKPCVIVDNSNLMSQWIKAFLDFTDLTVDDIGIGKQKIFDVDKPVCIFMVQSLLSKLKKDPTSAFELIDGGKFGVVFYDEVHNTSASEQYAKSSILFRTKNIIGLSATPFHSGSSEILMKNTVGEVIYETNKYELIPKFKLIYYNSALDKYRKVIMRVQDYLKKKAMYNSIVTNSENYINLITENTKKLLKDSHKIMILCFTHKQILSISEALDKIGISNKKFYGEEKDIEYNEDVLVATYSFSGKGFDYPALSALILACPLAGKKSLIQVCGRILRKATDKTHPIVISLVDLCFPTLFVPEVQKQKTIIKNEFNCKFEEEKWNIE